MNSRIKSIIAMIHFILLVFFTTIVSSFGQQIPFNTIGLKDGLPQSIVHTMIQDSQGYMWLATPGGLCRYDGTRFKVYSQYDGIGSQFIINIQFDDRGQLWLATYGNGIACFDGKKFTNFNESSGLWSNQIRSFLRSKSNNYFISSIDTGIIWVNKYLEQKIVLSPEGEKIQYARDMLELPDGNIWIGFNKGILVLDHSKNYSPTYILKDREIFKLYAGKNNEIWVGGTQTLFQFGKDSIVNFSPLLPEDAVVWDILEDEKTSLLYIATSSGLMIKNKSDFSWITTKNGLTVNEIKSLTKDSNGNIWTGLMGGGLVILDNKGIDHFTSGPGISDFAATTIVEDLDGNMWIGTNNQGLINCNGTDITRPAFVSRRDIKDPFVSCVDPVTGDLFFSEFGGTIVRIKNGKVIWKFIPPGPDPMRVICIQYFKDRLFISTQTGIFTLSEKNNKLKKLEEIGDLYCAYSFSDSEGNLWILSDGGRIIKWKNGRSQEMTDKINPERSSAVHGIYDPVHKIHWFCTYSGLIAWNGHDAYKLHSKNGIHSDSPWSIVLDHSGRIWLGLPNGIECIDFDKRTSQFFGYDQGFTPIETNSCVIACDKKGDIWFGTVYSVSRIRTKDIQPKKSIVHLWIEQVKVNENPVFEQDLLTDKSEPVFLSYNQNNLVIELNGICFDNAKDVKYSWNLSGFDEKWTPYNTGRKAIYSNLPPGSYTFKAKAIDPNGFEANEVELKFFIQKPVWNRWWFYVLEVALMIFIIFLSFRFSSDSSQNKLGSVLTLVSILIIFEAILLTVSGYVNKFTGGIPIFQLIMNVILAGTLHPLEQLIRKFMKRWAIKRRRQKTVKVEDTRD